MSDFNFSSQQPSDEERIRSLREEIHLLIEERNALKAELSLQQNTYKDLGQRLSAASSDREVGSIILDSAQAQIGWDAGYLAIYDPKTDLLTTIAEYDRRGGEIVEFKSQYANKTSPGPITRRVLKGYSFYGNREKIVEPQQKTSRLGTDRKSESMIVTPLIDNHRSNFGVISIHSYSRDVYGEREHGLFRSLADFCGDALLRSHSQTKLRYSEERLNFALSGTNLGVWDWNLETDEVTFTEKFTEMLGYNFDEVSLYENFWSHITHQEDMNVVLQSLQDHIEGKTPIYEMWRRMKRKDGSWRWFVDRGKVVDRDSNGKATRITGTIYDITEKLEADRQQKELEAQLQEAQKIESLGLLAGGIAHDFNNLLVSITGNIELALSKLDPNHEVVHLLRDADDGALQAARLTDQILTYAGKSNFQQTLFSFSDLVKSMSQLLSISISKKIRLFQELESDLPMIEGDETQIRQVVMNLITNASDAIGKNEGEITLSTSVVFQQEPPENPLFKSIRFEPRSFICFSVKDSGCGMDAQTKERIFEPFFTTKATGKGLGLAATLGIIRRHQGFLEIESVPNKGTTFKMFLPILSEKELEDHRKEDSSSGRFPIMNPNHKTILPEKTDSVEQKLKGKVLIIDDESSVRDVATRMLTHHGMKTIEAANGKMGLQAFKENQRSIQFILLDCMMPQMNGFEVYEEIRKLDKEVPILFSSGYNEPDSYRSIVLDPFVGYIQKPYRKATLLTHVQQLLEKT